ncbi:MAG: OsmC family protein [Deltaproteobacteria bacterium]|nr:OsmC family protein [Deltaproteobacteria bacterium]
MSEHRAHLKWSRNSEDFSYETYDRIHQINFEGGQKLNGTSAKEFGGKPEFANPEELLAAAAASCHMLTFLAICARKRIVVNSYEDHAVAFLSKNENGKLAVTKITLSPKILFQDPSPEISIIQKIHEKSHQECFIAQSLKCTVEIKEHK